VVELADLHGVLYPVALSRVDSTKTERVIDRLVGHPVSDMNPSNIDRRMRDVIEGGYDRQTGLISLSVVHKDSALARLVLQRVLSATRHAFVTAARAQATELRRAQMQRVDSAERQLASIDRQILEFNRDNRVVAPYSEAYIFRQRLDRQAEIAKNVYSRAVADREAAIAKELEETPAVIEVDPVPDLLFALPRRTALKAALAAIAVFGLCAVLLIVRDMSLGVREGSPDRERVRSALRDIPLLRRLVA
jgi:hypothetical protein